MCFATELCKVWWPKVTRARKRHTCVECGETISPGETYLVVRAIDAEDQPFTHKECRRCCYDRRRVIEIEKAAGCEPSESDPGCGGLAEALQDYGDGFTPRELVPAGFEIRCEGYAT